MLEAEDRVVTDLKRRLERTEKRLDVIVKAILAAAKVAGPIGMRKTRPRLDLDQMAGALRTIEFHG